MPETVCSRSCDDHLCRARSPTASTSCCRWSTGSATRSGASRCAALLRVIGEQVDVVEDDIARLYDNWFIETCDDWVVPYIGDLVGYRPVHEAGEPGEVTTAAGRQRNRILIPRREVANTIAYRRRKGTLALLEAARRRRRRLAGPGRGDLPAARLDADAEPPAADPRRASPTCASTLDLRRLDGPFDRLAHTVDVRRIPSARTPGRHNIPTVGVFVWRLRT